MLNIIQADDLDLPETLHSWLFDMPRATVVEVKGKDSSRCRVVSALVHGNEPSGLIAAYEYLKNALTEQAPATNVALIISSVRAARQEPMFTHRFMPGEFDLNRRFGLTNTHDRVSELAQNITGYIRDRKPEAVIDLHNTSGSSPSFAVAVSDQSSIKKIAGLFTSKLIITHLSVGALMEQNFNCPVVTIECGGAKESESHQLAIHGLKAFVECQDLTALADDKLQVFVQPIRVTAREGVSLCYGDSAEPDVGITLLTRIEQLNQHPIEPGTCLGWLHPKMTDCLQAMNDKGINVINDMFERDDNNRLLAKSRLQLFMATSRADIALSDCLFYAVPVT